MHDYWQKQSLENPLFPDLLWSRPENSKTSGRLLIIGGNEHGFAAISEAYSAALSASIGQAVLLIPSSLSKTLGKSLLEAIFAPSTPSGSLGRQALASIIDEAEISDACLLAGDFGRNSETAILLESFLMKFSGKLTVTGDGLDFFLKNPKQLLNRSDTLLVPTLQQLQKVVQASHETYAITSDIGLVDTVEKLHKLSLDYPALFMFEHEGNVFVSYKGNVSSTVINGLYKPVEAASKATTWWTQNPAQPFESLTSSLV